MRSESSTRPNTQLDEREDRDDEEREHRKARSECHVRRQALKLRRQLRQTIHDVVGGTRRGADVHSDRSPQLSQKCACV